MTMKTILTLTILLLAGMQNLSAETNDLALCKTFIEKGKAYKNTLENTKSEDATLAFYKENIISHCGSIVARVQYQLDFFPQLMVKKRSTTIGKCKTSIKIAKSYKASDTIDNEVIKAFKENIVDNCGTLVTTTEADFCLFDIVDNTSVEKLKSLCITAIKDAHRVKNMTKDSKMLTRQRANILEKCGNLHATL